MSSRRSSYDRKARLPDTVILEITEIDSDGEMLAKPVPWPEDKRPPEIYINPGKRGHAPLAVGERVLARLKRQQNGSFDANVLKPMGTSTAIRVVGIYEPGKGGGRLQPTDRREKDTFLVTDAAGAKEGELVLAEILPSERHFGPRSVKVLERLGHMGEARSISLIAIHTHDLPTMFSPEALQQAKAARPADLGQRTDLRNIPLITIDGSDARDFDDAVFAEKDTDPANPGGWHLIVAIADVSHYVTSASALDKAAFERGNSTYFPDRVVPMLPEELSNDLCSLRPNEDRACLAVHMWIDRHGELKRHQFVRGLMRSAARLTYDQVQAAYDGQPEPLTAPLLEPVIKPLYQAFQLLTQARQKRGTLELDLPERQVKLEPGGQIAKIFTRPRYDSHRLIEEFMILANVAAAQALEARGQPCMYRIHDRPAEAKLEALREFLKGLGYSLPKGDDIRPRNLTQILEKVVDKPEAQLVNDVMLRSQAQAVYSPDNIGHFGLALTKYAHFTSPIRRYADLLVHRALIRGYKLGNDGLTEHESSRMANMAEHISVTERRSATAERDAVDRYVAAYLQDKIGQTFSGRIGGVTHFGLFVTLDETGADGLVPIRTLPRDYYRHDEVHHRLIGEKTRRVYRLGMKVKITLVEADPIQGSTLFHLLEAEEDTRADSSSMPPRSSRPDRSDRPSHRRSRSFSKKKRRG